MFSIPILEETTEQLTVTWLLWVALGFFVVMVIVGWLVSCKQKPEGREEKHPEHNDH